MARKNKDLVAIYLALVKAKKKVFFKKADFLFKIVKEIEERKKIKSLEDIYKFINKEKSKKINKLDDAEKSPKNILDMEEEDIYDIMESLLDFFVKKYQDLNLMGNANGFVNFVKSIAQSEPSENCITVGSIHAMKGLEADNVFIINYFKMPYEFGMGAEYSIQERNLKYIAETRTKKILYLCGELNDKESLENFEKKFGNIIDLNKV